MERKWVGLALTSCTLNISRGWVGIHSIHNTVIPSLNRGGPVASHSTRSILLE
jgi:hypothetical protein